MKQSILTVVALFGLGIAQLQAMPPEAGEETIISANHLNFDYRDFVATFIGDVSVVDPQFRMTSDRMIVYFEGTNDVRQVKAAGNVQVFSEDRRAYADEAYYTKAEEQIILVGNASLQRGLDAVRGDRITIWLNDERVECEPGMLVIAPGQASIGQGRERKQP